MIRLQKFLADSGLASRRASEEVITAGRVSVNGQIVRELGAKVDPERDQVAVDGDAVKLRRKQYVALHKPPGFLCAREDDSGRPLVGELLPREWRHLYTVGRLDLDSEGLLFLTNDGQFSLRLTHPRYGIPKTYLVTLAGRVEPNVVDQMVRGARDHGDLLKAERARLLSTSNKQSIVEVVLREGKNREVRRLCAALGLSVRRLQRLQIGPIKLGELPPGKWRTLTEPEVKTLLSQL